MHPPRFLLAIAAALLAGSAVACAGPGRTEVAVPSPPQSAGFALSSPAFTGGGRVPVRHTCDGDDVSPPLAWAGAPSGTAALILLVDDPDAQGFVHWIAGPIPATTSALPEGVPAAGPPPQGRNSFGAQGWRGPCPPSGTHRYVFRLIALPAGVAVPQPLTGEAARGLIGRALGVAELDGRYGRP